jgi:acetyl esterase/lipase
MSFKIILRNRLWLILLAAICVHRVQAEDAPPPPTILLWPGGAPLAHGKAAEDQPKLTIYLPQAGPGKAALTRTGVLVCPGGAYAMLAMDHEGKQIARWLNNLGIAAFVLQYRLGTNGYHHPAELMDAQRGLRYVRSHAEEFHVEADRIGIWGFSAGGHLASTVGTHFDAGDAKANDAIDQASSRPDFMILAYPVIDPLGHASVFSFQQLLGEHPDPKLVAFLSSDQQVTPQTPPTFLVHADDDDGVLPENSINFYLALRKAHVPAEMHIYQFGGHGFGLAPLDPVLSSWTGRLADWLRGRNLLQP